MSHPGAEQQTASNQASTNPLAGIIPLMPYGEEDSPGTTATVTSTEPIRVQLDSYDAPPDATPLTLIQGLIPGDRVYVLRHNRQLIIVGKIQPSNIEIDASTNLNNLVKNGTYYILGSGNASLVRNYPVASAGFLRVTVMAHNFLEQEYTEWSSTSGAMRKFVRQCYSGSWRPWSEIETWTDWVSLSYQNGWSDYGNGFQSLQYRRSAMRVEFRGVAKPGTLDAAICTLPPGARPTGSRLIGSAKAWTSQTNAWRLNVTSNGVVSTTGLGAHTWLSFDGVTFSLT